MDSGNSGSLQSSSGADEECDSRAAVDDLITTHHQPPFNHHMFDQNQINNPLFFTSFPQQHHHQLLNHESVVWSKTLPSFSDHHHFFPSSSSQPTLPFSPATTTTTTVPPPRNPKKRSRASRRAPTTVLTTDTGNFRAMVQQFTGIPATPFPTSFDLFGRSSSSVMRSNANNNFDNLPAYLLRPFPQKVLQSSGSSLLDSSNLLANTMQNSISFPNPKITQNEYGVIHEVHTSLPDLVSSKGTAPTTRNDDRLVSGNWDGGGGGGGGGGVNYTNGKESSRVITDHHQSSGMKADQGFVEPWICSSD